MSQWCLHAFAGPRVCSWMSRGSFVYFRVYVLTFSIFHSPFWGPFIWILSMRNEIGTQVTMAQAGHVLAPCFCFRLFKSNNAVHSLTMNFKLVDVDYCVFLFFFYCNFNLIIARFIVASKKKKKNLTLTLKNCEHTECIFKSNHNMWPIVAQLNYVVFLSNSIWHVWICAISSDLSISMFASQEGVLGLMMVVLQLPFPKTYTLRLIKDPKLSIGVSLNPCL